MVGRVPRSGHQGNAETHGRKPPILLLFSWELLMLIPRLARRLGAALSRLVRTALEVRAVAFGGWAGGDADAVGRIAWGGDDGASFVARDAVGRSRTSGGGGVTVSAQASLSIGRAGGRARVPGPLVVPVASHECQASGGQQPRRDDDALLLHDTPLHHGVSKARASRVARPCTESVYRWQLPLPAAARAGSPTARATAGGSCGAGVSGSGVIGGPGIVRGGPAGIAAVVRRGHADITALVAGVGCVAISVGRPAAAHSTVVPGVAVVALAADQSQTPDRQRRRR